MYNDIGGDKVKKNSGAKKTVAKNLNCQVNEEDYEELKQIAKQLGGMSLSALMRMLISSKLAKYRETKDPKVFLDI